MVRSFWAVFGENELTNWVVLVPPVIIFGDGWIFVTFTNT